eukprot:1180427-Prorocentrum_minimum.AAC.5
MGSSSRSRPGCPWQPDATAHSMAHAGARLSPHPKVGVTTSPPFSPTHSGHQSQKGEENILIAGTHRRTGKRIFPSWAPISEGENLPRSVDTALGDHQQPFIRPFIRMLSLHLSREAARSRRSRLTTYLTTRRLNPGRLDDAHSHWISAPWISLQWMTPPLGPS